MVGFGEKLQDNKVAKWRLHYLDYETLKQVCITNFSVGQRHRCIMSCHIISREFPARFFMNDSSFQEMETLKKNPLKEENNTMQAVNRAEMPYQRILSPIKNPEVPTRLHSHRPVPHLPPDPECAENL